MDRACHALRRRHHLLMKTTILIPLCFFGVFAIAQAKDINTERLWTKDTDNNGKLSKEELGEKLWQRMSGQDANADGAIDKAELEAILGKGRRGKEEQERPGGANLSFHVREFKATNGQTLRYSLFVPAEKAESPLPLVLCLHGAGGNTQAANLLASAEMQKKHPCIVMAPACGDRSMRWAKGEFRGGEGREVMPELIETLDAVIAETKADTARIYITGQSMGGMGTWGALARHPQKFAAAVPVCGIWETKDAPKMNGVAIWAFHGDQDEAVPVSGSRDMIAALKQAGVKPEPKYTELPGVGHGSWNDAYNTAAMWEWMFARRRMK
jgi:predicted peptidase